jgi:hypothetical protein
VEESAPEQPKDSQEYFPPDSPPSRLSSASALAELVRFRESPFFAYYAGRARAEADNATRKVFEPLDPKDPYAKEHREQLIGEAQAYLFIPELCQEDLQALQEIVTNQTK